MSYGRRRDRKAEDHSTVRKGDDDAFALLDGALNDIAPFYDLTF